ncbi:hypothetical protein QTJ16_003095 [Diplocarpon rosae]|uniref:GED domain-containing protein n=1 Tax=Diplocarpon rosae TaxID=946125 RepID=A0AAD9T210_9HELO|nr:hypothetical protein QTJ16_003095 [Diplocarpon rosae]
MASGAGRRNGTVKNPSSSQFYQGVQDTPDATYTLNHRHSSSASVPSLQHRVKARTMADPPPPQGLEFVGKKVKILVDAIDDLRKFHLEQVVGLPELVLVGDQSAGKSSLMSALTEVQLPKDQGICTKCPANIKTSPADKWSCSVSLQQDYYYQHPRGGIVSEHTVTKNNPFPPWKPQEPVIKEFKTITKPSELGDLVKWAQIAILNHNDEYTDFIPGSGARAKGDYDLEKEGTVAKFSPNVISIEISGPGLSALSFYDLPGVFSISSNEDEEYLPKVIENLAIKYIKRPNALIIWTLAMKTDPNNSHTGKVIRTCKAIGRCVGVLTNPDHVSTRHIEYEKILQGKSHVVKHGYFVTRQPGENSQIDNDRYHALARQREMEFFNTDPLWTTQWARFRNRCGTTAIQRFLSTELARQIMASIPSIKEKIGDQSRNVDQQLKECPVLPDTDIRNTIMRKLSEFSNDVRSIMYGEQVHHDLNSDLDFQSGWSTLADQFRDLVCHIKPTVVIAQESDRIASEVIEIASDDDDDVFSRAKTPASRKRPGLFSDFPAAQRHKHNSGNVNPVKAENAQMQPPQSPFRLGNNDKNSFRNSPFEALAGLGKGSMDLNSVRASIAKHQMGLPGIVSPQTYNELCLKSVAPWGRVLEVFIAETFSLVEKQLAETLHNHLGVYEQTALYRAAQKHLQSFIEKHKSEQRRFLSELHSLETFKSYTVNKASMGDQEAKEFQCLTAARKLRRSRMFVDGQMRADKKMRLSADLPPEEKDRRIRERVAAVTDEQLKKDPFDSEVRVASYVRAYYMTAGLRFVDTVCLSMKCSLFRKIRENVTFHLETELGIIAARNGEEVCRDLMEEDDTVDKRRKNLRKEKERLDGFTSRLETLQKQIEETDDEDNYRAANAGEERNDGSARSRRPSEVSSNSDTEMGESGLAGERQRSGDI